MRHCIIRAFDAGELLSKAKAAVPHGKWAQWLEDNCKLPERTAQRYMRLHDNRKEIEEGLKLKSAAVADLTLRQAEQLITAPGSKSAAGSTSAQTSTGPAKLIGSNDPESAVRSHEDKYFSALQTLKRNDHDKAKAVVNAFRRRLHDAELM
jgi:hypothetical protein